MPSLPVSRRRALLIAAAALALLAVAGRWLADAGTATVQPAAALVPERAAATPALVVHVAGAVRQPGLYRLAEGKRVADAVARAGGATAPADTAAINLAAPLADGMQVIVPSRVAGAAGAAGPAAPGRVSLSSASAAELDALPGVGPVTAQKIVDYRSAHGGFRSIDDLDAIPGIGPTRIEQLREPDDAVIERAWPTLLVLAACLGLAAANGVAAPALLLVLVGLSAAIAVASPRARLLACAVAIALAGWLWGSARLEAFERTVLASELGRSGDALAVVTGPARKTPFTLRVPAEVRRFGGLSLRERVLLELPVGRSPPQGAVLALRATIATPRGPDDGFDERGWLARRGVHVILRGRGWRIAGRRGGIGGISDRLRAHVARAIAPGLDGQRRAVLAGIVLGEDEGLSDELRDNFKDSGLYHLLAVSGQNITFLALGVLGLAWLLGIPRLPAEVAALAAITGYVLAVGWQPSVVRAGVAGGLASLAWLVSRPQDRWHFLALGAAVLLAWTPASLLEPGFQLSFAAVGSIFLLVPRLRRALEGYPMPAGLREVIAISRPAERPPHPILWLQFGSVPVYSLLANALVTAAIGPLLGLALVGSLIEPLLPSAALALAWLNGWVAAYIAACAKRRRRIAARPDRICPGGVRAARGAARVAPSPAPASVAAADGARVSRDARAGAPHLAAPADRTAAATDGVPAHGPRRGPRRRDPASGA